MAPEKYEPVEMNTYKHMTGIWVKNGTIHVKSTSSEGKVLAITPCDGVELVVNGAIVSKKTDVTEKDDIVLTPLSMDEPGSYQIITDSDRMSVNLELRAGKNTRYLVEDLEAENNLVLKAERRIEKTCPFTLDEILQDLSKRNITYGVRHGEIQAILSKPEDGIYLIAEGEPPGETVNDRVEFRFNASQEEQKVDYDREKVNFRDMVEIPSVEPGTLLAVKYPGIQGKPGKNINGDTIKPPIPQIIELTGGNGAELSPDGYQAYARIGGRPLARQIGKRCIVDVDPVLHKKGDIDITSGNIRFKGDVVIHGNVNEGMTIQAAGKINILGMIFEARIAAQGDITVMQNITGSNLVAGGNNSFFRAFYKILEALQSDLSSISAMVSDLARHSEKLKDVKAGQLIQLIIDKKFARVPGLINEMIRLSGQNTFIVPREMVELLEKVEKKLSGLNVLKIETSEEFLELLTEMKEVLILLNNMAGDKSNITFSYSVNSRIEASGDVKVEGLGCINTVIGAGGNVVIKGVFRGGEIIAGGDIILNEAGSEMGARTQIRAGKNRKILIRKAYEGVRVQVGDRMANINMVQQNLRAELDDGGDLVVLSVSKS